MRIWILIFSAALFAGGTCLGVALQPKLVPPEPPVKIEPPTPQPTFDFHRHDFSVHRFASELELTGEQDRELDAILGETQDEMRALGRAMRAAQEKSRERIVAILTPEQKSKLDSLMSAERAKRHDADLDRTVAAYTKILALNEAQAKELRTALTDSRKMRRRDGDWRQSRKEAREHQNKALEKSLSPEQYQRYLGISELERYER